MGCCCSSHAAVSSNTGDVITAKNTIHNNWQTAQAAALPARRPCLNAPAGGAVRGRNAPRRTSTCCPARLARALTWRRRVGCWRLLTAGPWSLPRRPLAQVCP